MPSEEGIVKQTRGDLAVVVTQRGAMCHSCKAHDACNTLGGGEEMEVEALNPIHARPGDRVKIELSEGAFLWASIQVYLIPPLFLLVGAVVGQSLAPRWGLDENLGAMLLGFGAFALAFLLVKMSATRETKKTYYRPTVVEIIRRPAPRPTPE